MRRAPVGWRLGKSLCGFTSGILVGVSGLYDSGLRGRMGSLKYYAKVDLLLYLLLLYVSCSS